MVLSKELANLKKQVKRLKANVAALKSNATDDVPVELIRLRGVVSKLRVERMRLKEKTERLEERLINVDLVVVQRKRLKEKTERLEEKPSPRFKTSFTIV